MKTTYKVMAAAGFLRWKEGEEFEAELDEGLERRALERGQIKKKPAKTTKGKEAATDG